VPPDAGPDLGYVFVMTYGRSGSTLVQGLLNAIPGYLVRGENQGALHHLFTYHRTLEEESVRGRPENRRRPTHPFFGISDFDADASVEACRRLFVDTVLRPAPDTRVTGFKEIRWYQPDLAEYVAWIRRAFPGARFVVNTRDHRDVLRSKWWAKGDNADYLRAIEDGILAVAAELGPAAYHLHYDDFVRDPAVLAGLFAWLGEDFDLATVQATLDRRHSV
jgi:hypothetical protein